MLLDKSKLKKIKGDASFRTFFRKKIGNKKSIIVTATKEKKKNISRKRKKKKNWKTGRKRLSY